MSSTTTTHAPGRPATAGTVPAYLLAIAAPVPPRAIVPVTSLETYRSALKLVRAIDNDVAAVTTRTGPLVPASRLDRWIDGSDAVGQHYMPLGLVAGGMGSAMLLPGVWLQIDTWKDPIPLGVFAALGAVCFAAFCASLWARGAYGRIAKHKARIAEKRFEADDVDAMTRTFRAAPDAVKAVVRAALDVKLLQLQTYLSPTARTRAAAIASEAPVPADARASRVSAVVVGAAELLAQPATPSVLRRIEQVLAGTADVEERRAIAVVLRDASLTRDPKAFDGESESNLRRILDKAEDTQRDESRAERSLVVKQPAPDRR